MLPSMSKVTEELQLLENEEDIVKRSIQSHAFNLEQEKRRLNEILSSQYEARQRSMHIAEIIRLAKVQFPRLRKQDTQELTQNDVHELEKLIGRAKSMDGLKNIVDALMELTKYYPEDIKSNLYGLVQRIIIGGANGTWKKKK